MLSSYRRKTSQRTGMGWCGGGLWLCFKVYKQKSITWYLLEIVVWLWELALGSEKQCYKNRKHNLVRFPIETFHRQLYLWEWNYISRLGKVCNAKCEHISSLTPLAWTSLLGSEWNRKEALKLLIGSPNLREHRIKEKAKNSGHTQ